MCPHQPLMSEDDLSITSGSDFLEESDDVSDFD